MRRALAPLVVAATLVVPCVAHAAATITIVNNDGAGEGFNDPTPVVPVGGNAGVTLGQQRLNAIQAAALQYGALLTSIVTIEVRATFDALQCDATTARLGQAAAHSSIRDFLNAPVPSTWYPIALANSLASMDLDPANPDIVAAFNSSVGFGCALPAGMYLGLDANPPGGDIDLVTVAMHELAHGLGFFTLVPPGTGVKQGGFDDTYMRFLEDDDLGSLWPALTNAQRVASAVNTGNLHWTGANVAAAGMFLVGGREPNGQINMFAPSPVAAGSSVNHFDATLSPDEILEPAYTGANHNPGLAMALLRDIGWNASLAGPTTTTSTSTSTSTTTIPATCDPSPLGGCVAPAKAVLVVKESSPGNEKLKVVLKQLSSPVVQSQFGDPVGGGSQYNLCLYDAGGVLVADLNVNRAGDVCGNPPAACWKAISTLGWKYGDKDTASEGVAKIVAKGGDALKGKVVLKAANKAAVGQTNLPTGLAASLLNDPQATVQLVVNDGDCFGQTLTNVKKADGVLFKALEP